MSLSLVLWKKYYLAGSPSVSMFFFDQKNFDPYEWLRGCDNIHLSVALQSMFKNKTTQTFLFQKILEDFSVFH